MKAVDTNMSRYERKLTKGEVRWVAASLLSFMIK